jgi:hypothetical protein
MILTLNLTVRLVHLGFAFDLAARINPGKNHIHSCLRLIGAARFRGVIGGAG